jgi:hypothetical protein
MKWLLILPILVLTFPSLSLGQSVQPVLGQPSHGKGELVGLHSVSQRNLDTGFCTFYSLPMKTIGEKQ